MFPDVAVVLCSGESVQTSLTQHSLFASVPVFPPHQKFLKPSTLQQRFCDFSQKSGSVLLLWDCWGPGREKYQWLDETWVLSPGCRVVLSQCELIKPIHTLLMVYCWSALMMYTSTVFLSTSVTVYWKVCSLIFYSLRRWKSLHSLLHCFASSFMQQWKPPATFTSLVSVCFLCGFHPNHVKATHSTWFPNGCGVTLIFLYQGFDMGTSRYSVIWNGYLPVINLYPAWPLSQNWN